MTTDAELDNCPHLTHELAAFLRAFVRKLDARKLKANRDVTRHATRFGFNLPSALREILIREGYGEPLFTAQGVRASNAALARSGHFGALGQVSRRIRACRSSLGVAGRSSVRVPASGQPVSAPRFPP